MVSKAVDTNPRIMAKMMQAAARGGFISLRSTVCGSKETQGSDPCPV